MTVNILTGNEFFQVTGVQPNGQPSGQSFQVSTAEVGGTSLYEAAYSAASAITPAATGADNVLVAFTIPSNAFNNNYSGFNIQARGVVGANANTKEIKIIFNPATAVVGSTVGAGGTTIADTGSSTQSGAGWNIQATVYSLIPINAQYAQGTAATIGSTAAALGVPQFPTATESGAILVAITGNAGTAGTDIKLNFVRVEPIN